MEGQGYFYPGSFELKLLQSTRQGDFAFLNKDLIMSKTVEFPACWPSLCDTLFTVISGEQPLVFQTIE